MRVLFLANSNELVPNPDGSPLRSELVERKLREELGTVEVVTKAAWPTEKLPDIVSRWMDEYEPDIVYINVAEFWCLYESVPLRVRRVLGRFGTPLAWLGLKAADTPVVAHNRAFRWLQRTTQAVVGGDPHFTEGEVVERVIACARTALQREGTGVVVDGQRGRRKFSPTERGLRRIEARRLRVHRRLQAACEQLHVIYESDETPQWTTLDDRTLGFQRDGFHFGSSGQEHMAAESTELILRAVRELEGNPV